MSNFFKLMLIDMLIVIYSFIPDEKHILLLLCLVLININIIVLMKNSNIETIEVPIKCDKCENCDNTYCSRKGA